MFTIALRNLWRNRRRTALSLAVIAGCAAILVLVDSFVHGNLVSYRQSLIDVAGHLQIATIDYWTESGMDPADALLSAEDVHRLGTALAANPAVIRWSRGLDVSGLIGHQDRSTMMYGQTFEEPGDLLGTRLVRGRHVADPEAREILIGQGLAEQLSVDVGDRINIAAFALDGSLNAMTVGIAGVVRFFDSESDSFGALLPVRLVQQLLRTDGIHRIAVHLHGSADVNAAREALHAASRWSETEILALRWDEIMEEYEETKSFFDTVRLLARSGLILLGFFSILQIVTLAFLERTREIGTLRAIGTPRARILRTLLFEGLALGAVGAFLGTAGGAGLSALVTAGGLQWMLPGAAEAQPIVMLVSPSAIIAPFMVAFVTTVLSVVYPAMRGANTEIVNALRHV
jgi:putative ABC transport system permease protein